MRGPVPRPHLLRRPVDQIAVVIAEHVNGVERHQRVHRPPRVERPARHVAEIDDLFDALRADVGNDRFQREIISVDIGDRGKAHLLRIYPGGVPLAESTWPARYERARDQDARRHLVGEPRQRAQRRFDAGGDFHAHAERARGIRQPVRRHRIVLSGYLHRDDVARQPGEIGEECAGILVGHHADDHDQRTRHPLFEIAQRRGGDAAAFGIVAAVEPDLAALRRQLRPARPMSGAASAPAIRR